MSEKASEQAIYLWLLPLGNRVIYFYQFIGITRMSFQGIPVLSPHPKILTSVYLLFQ